MLPVLAVSSDDRFLIGNETLGDSPIDDRLWPVPAGWGLVSLVLAAGAALEKRPLLRRSGWLIPTTLADWEPVVMPLSASPTPEAVQPHPDTAPCWQPPDDPALSQQLDLLAPHPHCCFPDGLACADDLPVLWLLDPAVMPRRSWPPAA